MRLVRAAYRTLHSTNGGTIFIVCVFIAFMQAGLFSGHANHAADAYPDATRSPWLAKTQKLLRISSSKPSVIHRHPIPRLMDEAETQFRGLLKRQSKTLKAAVKEYRRRYKREPPKGFDLWWRFAQENGVKMVDEFDAIHVDLAPFWKISGKELRRRAEQVALLGSIELVRIRRGNATGESINVGYKDPNVGARTKGFIHLLSKFAKHVSQANCELKAHDELMFCS